MTDDDSDERRTERQRRIDEVRKALSEAHAAHSLSDEESELAMLNMHLDAEQQRLDDLMDDDPLRVIFFELDRND